MCPVGWQPKTTRLEDAIAEEELKIETLKQRQWVSAPVPTFTPLQIENPPMPIPESRLPVSKDYQPPQLPNLGNQVSADYQPPQLPVKQQTPLWEQPAAITEKVMSGVGQGISKIPGAAKALGVVAPAFEWIHENLEKPFASTITAPFSPTLAWRAGESWIEHQKREYATWEAPTYVKGAAEFAMPLWWIPYLGWAGKGAKALGASERVLRGIEKAGKIVTLKMPTDKLLNEVLYKRDFYKTAAMWAKDKPVLHQVVQSLGGGAAFVDTSSQAPEDVIRRAIMNSQVKKVMGESLRNDLPNRLQQYGGGDVVKVLGVDKDSLVNTAIPKVGKIIPETKPVTPEVTPKIIKIEDRARPTGIDKGAREIEAYDNQGLNSFIEYSEKPDRVLIHSISGGIPTVTRDLLSRILKRNPNIKTITTSPLSRSGQRYLQRLQKEGLIEIGQLTKPEIERLTKEFGEQFADPVSIRILNVIPKATTKGVTPTAPDSSRRLVDILEHPSNYTFSTPEAQNVVNEFVAIRKQLKDMVISDIKERYRSGVISQTQYQAEIKAYMKSSTKIHRNVLGITDENGKFIESKWGSNPSLERMYETQEEAVQAHLKRNQQIVYGNDPVDIIRYEIDRATNRIIEKNLTPVFSQIGKTAQEKFAALFPEVATDLKNLGNKQIAAQYALNTAQRIMSYKGTSIPGATLTKIETELPDIAAKLREALTLKPASVERVLSSISRELRSELKINAKELKAMVVESVDINLALTPSGVSPHISMSDIDIVVSKLNLSQQLKAKVITSGYRITAKENKQLFQDFLKANRDTLKQTVTETKAQLIPLKQKRWEFMKGYAGKEKLVGIGGKTTERTVPFFNHIPELRGKFYDDKVAKVIEKQYGDLGSKLSRQLGTFGAMSRNLTLALDNSILFIQGQGLLGRNPLLWAKTAKQQLEFIVHPENFAKYMADPARQVLHNEMRNAGMSIAPFEIVEASPLIAKALKKSPILTRVYKETYGRGEVMFTAYGQLAKDNLWAALRKPNMSQSELFELGRTLDRMTGVMSTEAIGIGRTQRDIESAWLFLTPRYTRASLAYIGDVMKGGISGAEARKSLGMLMAGGMTMYIGTTKMLGQTPNLDPTTSKFMTVKMGDTYVGIGGSMYTLMRLAANVASTASDPETRGDLSPLNFSRVDNPFYRYLYSKTSPLTGTFVEIMEQKNFMGEPFENIGDWGKFLADKVTPIAVQQTWEKGGAAPQAIASSFLGARTFPKSTWELQEDMRDTVAQEKYQLPYDQLDLLQKEVVDKSPQVESFQPEIDKQTTIRDKTINMAFLNRRNELDNARETHKTAIENLQLAYDAGNINGVEFKEGVINANIGYGATYEHIQANPEYADAIKKLQEPKEVSRAYRWELAYDELMVANSSNKFVDQYGQFDFTQYNQFLDDLKVKYGEADFNRAMEKKNLKYAEYPPLFQEFQKAKEILKPYWGVEDQVIRIFGKTYAESNAGKRLILSHKKQMRARDRAMNAAYEKFYSTS